MPHQPLGWRPACVPRDTQASSVNSVLWDSKERHLMGVPMPAASPAPATSMAPVTPTQVSPQNPFPRLPGLFGHSGMSTGPHRQPLGDTGTGLSLPCFLGFSYWNKRSDWNVGARNCVYLPRPSASHCVGVCPFPPSRPREGLLRALEGLSAQTERRHSESHTSVSCPWVSTWSHQVPASRLHGCGLGKATSLP